MSIATPYLMLNADRLERNCQRISDICRRAGVALRPHMKTAKSIDVARIATRGRQPKATVSTIAEARYFASQGFGDILYAVSVTENKLPMLLDIAQEFSADISVVLDSIRGLQPVESWLRAKGAALSVYIEIDCGGGRSGLLPQSGELPTLALAISKSEHLHFAGLLTHAGHSYACSDLEEIADVARQERSAILAARDRVVSAGVAVPEISIGSTPTIMIATNFDEVSEVRPGVYMLGDLDQVQLGVMTIDDLALSVATTVIGHNHTSGSVLVDAGALALSKDIGPDASRAEIHYGLVADQCGAIIDGAYVRDVHQEHGFIHLPGPFEDASARMPIGTLLRIFPNHACMTAAPHFQYHVVREGSSDIVETWPKLSGW